MALRTTALEKDLKTNVSDRHFVKYLDSYLYNSHGVSKSVNRVRFFMQIVDSNDRPVSYSIDGQIFVGLVLLINPSSINANLSKIVNRTQTMTGWVEDHWGEELDTISIQGSSASFLWGGPNKPSTNPKFGTPLTQTPQEIRDMYNKYMNIPDLGVSEPVQPGDHSGLTVKRRRETLSYDEFRGIMKMMNANAAKFDAYGLVRERLFIQLSYDYASYRGYFESIDVTEDSETPYKFIYTITFKAEKTIYSYLR
jgi:hypothetical protein